MCKRESELIKYNSVIRKQFSQKQPFLTNYYNYAELKLTNNKMQRQFASNSKRKHVSKVE